MRLTSVIMNKINALDEQVSINRYQEVFSQG